jgi:hypothetical protein
MISLSASASPQLCTAWCILKKFLISLFVSNARREAMIIFALFASVYFKKINFDFERLCKFECAHMLLKLDEKLHLMHMCLAYFGCDFLNTWRMRRVPPCFNFAFEKARF